MDVVAEEAVDVKHRLAGKHGVDVDALSGDAVDILKDTQSYVGNTN